MCRWREGHAKRAEHGPRHRMGNRGRVSKGRQLSMTEHGYRRGALGTFISTCLVPRRGGWWGCAQDLNPCAAGPEPASS